MQDRTRRLQRIASTLDVIRRGHDARLAALVRAECEIDTRRAELIDTTSCAHIGPRLVQEAQTRLSRLAVDRDNIHAEIERRQIERMAAHRLAEASERLRARAQRCEISMTERRTLEDLASEIAARTGCRKLPLL